MSKNERKRTMVYSNVNKKADSKSAYCNNNELNWENEIIIGINTPKKEGKKNGKTLAKLRKSISIFKNKKEKTKDKEYTHKNDSQIKESSNNNASKNKKTKISVKEKVRRQKIRAIKRIGTFFLLLTLVIGATIYFFLSPIFNIKSIEVINNSIIPSDQIIRLSGLSTGENIFKFSKKEAQNCIQSNPYIEDVQIKRELLSSKVQIDIKERVATLMLEFGNSYVYINNQGYILEISAEQIDSPIIKGYMTPLEEIQVGNRLNKDDLERLENVLKILETANSNGIGHLISHINVKNTKDYIIIMESEDKTVYLGNCTDLSTQMLYIKEMLEREKGKEGEFFIDMDLNTSNPVFREKV